jgi:hypothetical protein
MPSDAEVLARELTTAFRKMVDFEKEQLRRTAPEAVAKAEADAHPNYEKNILGQSPDQVTWYELEYLAERDPAVAARRWQEIREAAKAELVTGHQASRALEGFGSNAWQRAQFLALREELLGAWRPRNGMELQLIDAMAQARTMVLFWLQRLSVRASLEPLQERYEKTEGRGYYPPRVHDAKAVEQAAAMVEQFNKMYLQNLRTLNDLRRLGAAIIVHSAEQVNIGQQQVNVGPDTSSSSR